MLGSSRLITVLTGLTAVLAGAAYDDCDEHQVPTGCGEVNIIFTGLPPNHPLVTAQGFNSTVVAQGIARDSAAVRAAGYNLRVVLFGPEVPISYLEEQIEGTYWHGTGVGYGVRGSSRPDLTARLEETLQVYRDDVPFGKIIFNYNPMSSLAAAQRNFPLSSNCTDKPGKDLGTFVKCDICT